MVSITVSVLVSDTGVLAVLITVTITFAVTGMVIFMITLQIRLRLHEVKLGAA